MNIRTLWLSIALCLAPAIAQISLADLLNNPEKVKNIAYGTNLQTVPYTNFGQLADLVAGDAEQHFRETGDSYWATAYKITLTKGSRVRMKSSKIDGDSHLDVYWKNGGIYEFIDHNIGIYANDPDSYLSLVIQKDGDYYIVIADDSPEVTGYHTLMVWIPTNPLYTDIHYTSITANALPALGTKFTLVEIREKDFPGIGFKFIAEKGKTYAIKANYFSKVKHDMFYSITLLNKLTGDWNEDMVATNNKWDYDVLELSQNIIYTANESGTIYILLDNYDLFNIEKFYEDVYCAIEIKEVNEKAVSLAKFLDNTKKTIAYSPKLEFVTGGDIIDLVEGQTGVFRLTGNNYYAIAHKITLAPNDNIEILSSKEYPYTPWLDSYLYIYRKNGNEYEYIADNDYHYGISDNSMDSYLNFTATKAGDYYIVVTDASPDLAGSYYMKVWNTENRPDNTITAIHANANSITATKEEEILASLVTLKLSGTVGNGTVAIINNPHDWTIASDKHSATYKPATAPIAPYGFVYASELEPITINIYGIFSPVITKAPQPASFKAWAQNGTLHLNGLTTGKTWSVYTASGTMVRQGIANGANATVHLNAKGVYFVYSEKRALMVINKE